MGDIVFMRLSRDYDIIAYANGITKITEYYEDKMVIITEQDGEVVEIKEYPKK